VTQARAIQTKGGACDSGNTNYRGDTDSTVNLSCPDLVKKVRRKEREIEWASERPTCSRDRRRSGRGGAACTAPGPPVWVSAGSSYLMGRVDRASVTGSARPAVGEASHRRPPGSQAPRERSRRGRRPWPLSPLHSTLTHSHSHNQHKQIKGTPGYRPPSDACCAELIAWTEAGCACNADLKAQAVKENTKDLRVFPAMAKSTQILCSQKQQSISDPCGAPCNQAGASA